MSRARVKPSRPPSRLRQAILAVGVIALGFATLMVRLEVTQEGYRLSTLRSDNLKLEEDNRNLRLGVAEVASRERLRALAQKFNLGPPAPGQVVTLP
jgi:cell division protein FtsL